MHQIYMMRIVTCFALALAIGLAPVQLNATLGVSDVEPSSAHVQEFVQQTLEEILRSHQFKNSDRSYTLIFYSSHIPNAHITAQGQIFISSKLLDAIQNKGELSFVLAHELAHGNEPQHQHAHAHSHELQADRQALSYLADSGYGAETPSKLLRRLVQEQHFLSKSHAGLEHRIKRLESLTKRLMLAKAN